MNSGLKLTSVSVQQINPSFEPALHQLTSRRIQLFEDWQSPEWSDALSDFSVVVNC